MVRTNIRYTNDDSIFWIMYDMCKSNLYVIYNIIFIIILYRSQGSILVRADSDEVLQQDILKAEQAGRLTDP